MPFRSEAQRKLMWAKHPEIARKWTSEYGSGGDLPEHAAKRRAIQGMKKRGKLKR